MLISMQQQTKMQTKAYSRISWERWAHRVSVAFRSSGKFLSLCRFRAEFWQSGPDSSLKYTENCFFVSVFSVLHFLNSFLA